MSFHDRNLLGRTLGHAYKTGRAKGEAEAIAAANEVAEEIIRALMYEAGVTELELSEETIAEARERFDLAHRQDPVARTATYELLDRDVEGA